MNERSERGHTLQLAMGTTVDLVAALKPVRRTARFGLEDPGGTARGGERLGQRVGAELEFAEGGFEGVFLLIAAAHHDADDEGAGENDHRAHDFAANDVLREGVVGDVPDAAADGDGGDKQPRAKAAERGDERHGEPLESERETAQKVDMVAQVGGEEWERTREQPGGHAAGRAEAANARELGFHA